MRAKVTEKIVGLSKARKNDYDTIVARGYPSSQRASRTVPDTQAVCGE
jgi:hypothetical protein